MDVVKYELLPSQHEGYVVAQWELRTKTDVQRYRHEFKEDLPIGAVFNVMSEHFNRNPAEIHDSSTPRQRKL